MPEVSVVIPTYNSVRYLTEAVDSVLAQTFRDLEVIVVDDGSTDETELVMRRYPEPVRYIRQKNAGVAEARNRGIREASGRYIAFLDADDTWYPHKLERQLAELRRRPDCRFCYSAFTVVDPDLAPLGIRGSERRGSPLEDLLLRGNVIGSICTVLCERELLESSGGFDPELSQCADWDMWVRLATATPFAYVDEPLVTYRHHDGNMSRSAPLLEHDSLVVLEKGFSLPDLPAGLSRRRREGFARNYMVLAGAYFHAGRYLGFARCAARAVSMDFRQLGYLFAYPSRVGARLRTKRTTQPA